MQIVEYKDQKTWNYFVAGQKQAQFLHSWEWGELQEKEGRKIWRMAIIDEGQKEILAVFLLVKMPLVKNYYYFYTPRGPIFKVGYNAIESWDKIKEKIQKLAMQENIVFWRFEPLVSIPSEIISNFKEVVPVQPKNTLILNLGDTEENLLKKMHSKTRYNIKVAQKKGIVIKQAENIEEGMKIFWDLLVVTAKRQNFVLHNFDHYLNIVKSDVGSRLYIASSQEKNIAAVLNVDFGDTSTYLHGASSKEFRSFKPAPFLQWEAIKEAKKAGHKYYDFWGINKEKNQKSNLKNQKWDYKIEWDGITRFKKGFGGEEINFPGAYEMPIIRILYNFYKLYKMVQ